MENKQALTLVSLEFLNLDEIEKYLSHNFSISINSKKSLSPRCLDFEINCLNEKKEEAIRKYFNSKKIDICIQDLNFRDKKLFISDMDEYFETRKKIEEQKNQINKITDKFKELRSLVYGYKDDKEKEISNLSEDQLKLKNELETHRISYETLVDKATLEIENFIKKHDTDTNIQ